MGDRRCGLGEKSGERSFGFQGVYYELHYALSSDDFQRQATEGGIAKKSNLGLPLRFLLKRSWLKDVEDDNDGKVEEETQKADTAIVLIQCDFYDKNWHVESVRKAFDCLGHNSKN